MKKLILFTLILIGILSLGAQNVAGSYVNTDRILVDSNYVRPGVCYLDRQTGPTRFAVRRRNQADGA